MHAALTYEVVPPAALISFMYARLGEILTLWLRVAIASLHLGLI